jgi:hypothetical protein
MQDLKTNNRGDSLGNEELSQGLQAGFHSMMNDQNFGRKGMSFDASARSYFVRPL